MRVISLLPSATDAIVALGGLDLLVGVSHACDAPKSIPRVTAPAVDATATSGAIDAAVPDWLRSPSCSRARLAITP